MIVSALRKRENSCLYHVSIIYAFIVVNLIIFPFFLYGRFPDGGRMNIVLEERCDNFIWKGTKPIRNMEK